MQRKHYIFSATGYVEATEFPHLVAIDIELHNRDHEDKRVLVECEDPRAYVFEGDAVRPKTVDELERDKVITKAEAKARRDEVEREQLIAQEMQAMEDEKRTAAVERLKAAGKI